MKHNHTDITIVLDRSGSMQHVKDDTIGGFNRFLSDQKACPGTASLTLNQFDHEFECVASGQDIQQARDLTGSTFVPRGNTALLDAIGRSINETGARIEKTQDDQRPEKVVLVILTDGQENASHEFTREKVFEMLKHQREKYGWQVVFLGANQDAIKAAQGFGIAAANAMTYAANKVGTTEAFADMGSNLRSFRTSIKRDMSFEVGQIKKQREAGAKA